MSSDFEGYEQDFAVLTAEITNKIARVPRLPPDEKKQMVANVEKQLEEAKELVCADLVIYLKHNQSHLVWCLPLSLIYAL